MRWMFSLSCVGLLLISGCGDSDAQPVAENGASQTADPLNPSDNPSPLANAAAETVGVAVGETPPPAQPMPPMDNTEPPKKELVEATADTVGTKGKEYGGGIITEPIHQYFRLQDKLKLDQIEYGLKLYHAEHGRYPATMQEFVDQILTPQQVKLPELPPGRKFVYDPQQGKLFVQSEQ